MLAAPVFAQSSAQNAPRQHLNFNANWRFHLGDFPDAKPLGQGYKIESWRFKSGNDSADLTADTAGATWKTVATGDDVFGGQKGFGWFRATLAETATAPTALHFASVDDNATVYLNGQRIRAHQGWNSPFDASIGTAWKPDAPNEIAVLVENTAGAGGIMGEVGLQIGAPIESAAIGANYDDSRWRLLDLPHDWGVEGDFDIDLPGETGKLPWQGVGWYRKTFAVAANDANKRVSLEMDGAMSNARVWCNGQYVGGWPYGYASWALDLTPFIKRGAPNTLAIQLDNLPDSTRWYPGGGIYRDVHLTLTNPVHVAHWGTQIDAQSVGDGDTQKAGPARLGIKTTIQNQSAQARRVRLFSTVLDANLKVVARTDSLVSLKAGASQTVSNAVMFFGARKWNLKDPYRYTLVTQIKDGARVLDRYSTPFGVRDIAWVADKGFLLNGKVVQLHGVCMHHDLGALGAAWNRRAAQRQLQVLQSMGVNALRTSHNPPAPELLDLCDEMGILVLDEFSDTWTIPKKPNGYATLFDKWAEKDIRAMVQRDRNHPSVIAWSSGNEVPEQNTATGARISQRLTDIFHAEDPTRPVGSGNNYFQAADNGFQDTNDIFGFNYKPQNYPAFLKNHPTIPLFGSETASAISSRGEYFFPATGDAKDAESDFQVSSYDLYAVPWGSLPDKEFEAQDRNPAVAGEFVWTGFDYLGEPTPYSSDPTNALNYSDPIARAAAEKQLAELGRIKSPSRSSYFGIMDLAGFPKDRYYLYQAHWRPDFPMAHILPHWNWPERAGQVTPVMVYTSGDEAELFLNGKSLGRRKKGQFEYRLRWDDVVYQPGELRVVAYKNGKEWANDTVKTTGVAARIAMNADRDAIKNDGKDLSFVTVKIADAQGEMVPRSHNDLQFSIEGAGEIVATDNGDATDLTAFHSHSRRAFNGLALVIVRAKKGASGPIVLRASSDGLQSGAVTIRASE